MIRPFLPGDAPAAGRFTRRVTEWGRRVKGSDLWRCANREQPPIRHWLSVLDPMPVRLVRQEAPRQEACGQEGVQSRALSGRLARGQKHGGKPAKRANPANDG